MLKLGLHDEAYNAHTTIGWSDKRISLPSLVWWVMCLTRSRVYSLVGFRPFSVNATLLQRPLADCRALLLLLHIFEETAA